MGSERNVSIVTSVLVALACTGCTMLGGVDRFVPVRVTESGAGFEPFEPWEHRLGGHGLRMGGSPSGLRFASGPRTISVRAGEYSWWQVSVGPILPVIPVLMGAGPYIPELAIEVRVDVASSPLPLDPARCLVRVKGSETEVSPVRVSIGKTAWNEPGRALETDERIQLPAGGSAWLYYPIDNGETANFDLNLALPDGPVRLQFERQATPFLFIVP